MAFGWISRLRRENSSAARREREDAIAVRVRRNDSESAEDGSLIIRPEMGGASRLGRKGRLAIQERDGAARLRPRTPKTSFNQR